MYMSQQWGFVSFLGLFSIANLKCLLKKWHYPGINRAFGLLTVMVFLHAVGMAQSTFGSFVGTIRDKQGGVVAKATVTVVNKGTSAKRTTTTDSSGSYVLVNLEPGPYEITMEFPGFRRAVYSDLDLQARQTIRVDGRMEVGQTEQTVTVNAEASEVLTTEASNISETKTGRELLDLPVAIASRGQGSTSPITTLTTESGVQTDNAGNISVAGTKPSQLSISIDGISTMNPSTEAPITELFPSFDSIAEIRVSEENNSAEFGGVSDITTTSKGGSNLFHGGLFENNQNTDYNANNPFSTSSKPKLIMNDFGGFIGGPVILPKYNGHDKTFFFFSAESLRLARQTVLVESVPSLALRGGDLSAYSTQIKDPNGGTFSMNQIPHGRISQVALNALQYLFPLPNTGPVNAIANNFGENFPTPITSNQADIRIDQNITSRQTAFARFTIKRRSVINSPTGTVLAGPTSQPEHDSALTVAHNFAITPNLFNEVRGGLSVSNTSTSIGVSAATIASQLGLVLPQTPPAGSAFPTFSITGFQSTSGSASGYQDTSTKQILDNLTWTRGSHSVKVGGEFAYLTAYFNNLFASSRLGTYTFNNSSVTSSAIGNAYASFLLGIPDSTGVATVYRNGYKWVCQALRCLYSGQLED